MERIDAFRKKEGARTLHGCLDQLNGWRQCEADPVRGECESASAPEELRKAGIEYANRQMREVLSNTDCGVHIFIMNHPEIAQGLLG